MYQYLSLDFLLVASNHLPQELMDGTDENQRILCDPLQDFLFRHIGIGDAGNLLGRPLQIIPPCSQNMMKSVDQGVCLP